MRSRPRVLMVTSWYPRPSAPWENRFVHEHVRAAALVADVSVLHVPDPNVVARAPAGWEVGRRVRELDGVTVTSCCLATVHPRASFWLAQRAMSREIRRQGPFDVIHAHTLDAAVAAARQRSVPRVLTEHWSGLGTGEMTREQVAKVRFAYRRMTIGLPVSRFLESRLHQVAPSLPTRVVGNVIDTAVFQPSPAPATPPTLLFLGRLTPVKRVDRIIEATALARDVLPDLRLVIVGDGPLHRQLEEQVRRLGLDDAVTLTGSVNPRQVPRLLHAAHALVLASRTETFSVVAAEALACGRPVIAPAVGALPELVGDTTGRLVSDRASAGELADAMADVLQRRWDAARLHTAVAGRFDAATISRQLAEVYGAATTATDLKGSSTDR